MASGSMTSPSSSLMGSKIDPNTPMSSSMAGSGKIKRPKTIFDDGNPTDSIIFDAKRVLRLIEDERYLSAEVLYHSVQERIHFDDADDEESLTGSKISIRKKPKRKRSSSKKALDKKQAEELLENNKEIVQKMEDRCQLFKRVKKNLDVHDDWTLAQTLFGVTTYYRHEKDGSMSIKLEGPVNECSLFDQVAVIREFDLNHIWAPFVTSSLTVGYLDKLDIVGWFLIGLPHFGLMRDALFRAIGCDSIYEDGSVLIVAYGIKDRPGETDETKAGTDDEGKLKLNKSSSFDHEINEIIDEFRNDPILDTLDLPPVPTRMAGGRLTIRSVAAQIEVESPTSAITTLVANIDPNLNFLPQVLIDFVMKRMCGTILYKMKSAAKKVSKNPVTNLHAIKIREERDFYKNFLLPKLEGICKIRGWEMPPVAVFDLSDAQLEMAEAFKGKQNHKSDKNALEVYNSNSADSNLDDFLKYSNESDNDSEDAPKVRTVKDLDDMSDISKYSSASSFWRSNPISNYKRHAEEKAQQHKYREIQEERQRAAARLKPKTLDEDAKIRLEQLREARKRQKARKALPVVKENVGAPPTVTEENSMRRWKVSLASHGFFTKIFVLQFLMVFLFCLLYLEAAFDKVIAVRGESFAMERLRDAATLAYIGVTGFVHSVFCHIAFIYAFTSLQLGAIAGRNTRRFYSEYTHHAVAISSSAMVGFGITKPILDQGLRFLLWNAYSILNYIKLAFGEKTPDQVETVLSMILNAVLTAISATMRLTFESNILGRSIVTALKIKLRYIWSIISNPLSAYMEIVIKQYEGDLDPLPWREDAFFTTRILLSHSALFLLILLLLFNVSAKQARQAADVDSNSKTSVDKL